MGDNVIGGEIVPRIALKNAEAGMQLTRAVLNDAGVKLVDQGARITQEMLKKFVNAQVRYIFVVGQSDSGQLEEALSALEARFVRTKDKPHMSRLKRLLWEHLQELYF
jgi:hypothetical protein